MATYTVRPAQNIWDVALCLYGSIEGAFDLFISNPGLEMTTELHVGDVLNYHEGFTVNPTATNWYAENKVVPANGERNVYYREANGKLWFAFKTSPNAQTLTFSLDGNHVGWIDWGDNSDIEDISGRVGKIDFEHTFDTAGSHWVKFTTLVAQRFYEVSVNELDGEFYIFMPVSVHNLVFKNNSCSLEPLLLLKDVGHADFRGSKIDTLQPVLNMEQLESLDLRNTRYVNSAEVDSYLHNLVAHHNGRLGCSVWLPFAPGSVGAEAISTILNNEEWNKPRQWKFYLDGREYGVGFPYTIPITLG